MDVIDFNKSCEENRGFFLPYSGRQVAYHLCPACQFCFAPEFSFWSEDEFAKYVYNHEYEKVDPDCKGGRVGEQVQVMEYLLGDGRGKIDHLDYGAGLGLLSQSLNSTGWKSTAYDPFLDARHKPVQRFDLVTAFEVFEHVSNPNALMSDIDGLLKPDGLLFFSTLLADGHVCKSSPLDWWYAAPRNGHISLFSSESLRSLMSRHGFTLVSISNLYHYAYSGKPPC